MFAECTVLERKESQRAEHTEKGIGIYGEDVLLPENGFNDNCMSGLNSVVPVSA